jgi:hypothetical protein
LGEAVNASENNGAVAKREMLSLPPFWEFLDLRSGLNAENLATNYADLAPRVQRIDWETTDHPIEVRLFNMIWIEET